MKKIQLTCAHAIVKYLISQKILIDGKKAIIVKIGITQTVFGVYSPSGYTWRYVPNERISWIKLEKIVNPDLKISKNMLKIDSNHKEIQELKKKINGK